MITDNQSEPVAPEQPRRRFRKLRIAWSTICGSATVLLIVLWVRSYAWVEGVTAPIAANQALQFGSLPGVFAVGLRNVQEAFIVSQRPADEWQSHHKGPSQLWGGRMLTQSTKAVYLPFWLLVLLSASFAVVPWIRQISRRFSLRTLLIATTLVAVVLGAIVYTTR